MALYKRNQVEEAIAGVFELVPGKRASEVRTRTKRLLEFDRALGRKRRSKDMEQANFAFFSQEAAGTGADVLFSEYEAFAVLIGLKMMDFAWPQSFAVSILRRIRRDLEGEHARLLKELGGAGESSLAVFSNADHAPDASKTLPRLVRGFEDTMRTSRQLGAPNMAVFELAQIAHRLRNELINTQPRRRGRQRRVE
jgi:hypothetical protein